MDAIVDEVAALYERVAQRSGGVRFLAEELVRAGAECKNIDSFYKEVVKFSSNFKNEPKRVIERLYDDIQRSKGLEETGDEFNREFYGVGDEANAFIGDQSKWDERERMMQRRKPLSSRIRQGNMDTDQSAWEDNLMHRGGVKSGRVFDTDVGSELEERVNVVVHNIKPRFLKDGDLIYSLESAPDSASVVREEKSDMAVAASKGSAAVGRLREHMMRTKMKHKFWELGGSRIGKAMGVKEEEEDYGQRTTQVKLEEKASDILSKEEKVEASAQNIDAVRKSLPIYQVRDELLKVIRNNQVIVIVGETGSGKTTQLTQYLRESGFSDRKNIIACTQPRRVAAMSVAKRVAEEVGVPLGEEVGYSIRFEDLTSDKTEIKYMTDGVLMRESLSSVDLDRYSCVVMDEAHERSLYTDVLFGILKGVVIRRLDFKLIVTSATMDAEKFSRFFGGCATFHIPGRTYKVDTFFSKSTCLDYVEGCVKQALQIHLSSPPGDILIFMTGQEDITATCTLLAEKIESLPDGVPELLLLPMYSQLPSDLQAKIFQPAKPGQRKCIVSTNIAETSLTVDGIKYVIDSGFCKITVFNPRIGMDALRVVPVSQANANQRAGRAGRTSEGFCWRMYTENQFVRELLPAQVPEIQRTNLGNVVLLLKSLGVSDLLKFDFMDPPPKDNIINSMYQLWVLGALDDDNELTELGKQMARYPLDPSLSKMLLTAKSLGCTEEALTVVSMLSVPEVFYRPAERAEESDLARERFFVPESDHLTLLNVYNLCQKHRFSPSWCAKHFIHLKSVIKAREVREQLASLITDEPSNPGGSGTRNWDLVRKAICSAYFCHAARLKNITQYVNLLNGTPANLHPSSAICGIGETPDYVVYHELVLTSKEYMRTVTSIDPAWLAELGPMFFSIKGQARRLPSGALGASSLSSTTTDRTKNKRAPSPQKVQSSAGGGIIKKKKRKKFGL